jgi:hypothetical protein
MELANPGVHGRDAVVNKESENIGSPPHFNKAALTSIVKSITA